MPIDLQKKRMVFLTVNVKGDVDDIKADMDAAMLAIKMRIISGPYTLSI